MRTLEPQDLTAAAFQPFGEVIARPAEFGRVYTSGALANGRAHAKPSLSIATIRQLSDITHVATRMERHAFSSQSFVPLDVSRYLIMVAPHGPDGRPDAGAIRAFVARGDQAITYGLDVWHSPMVVLDRAGHFAVFMWLDGGSGDEELVDLPEPISVAIPSLRA